MEWFQIQTYFEGWWEGASLFIHPASLQREGSTSRHPFPCCWKQHPFQVDGAVEVLPGQGAGCLVTQASAGLALLEGTGAAGGWQQQGGLRALVTAGSGGRASVHACV